MGISPFAGEAEGRMELVPTDAFENKLSRSPTMRIWR